MKNLFLIFMCFCFFQISNTTAQTANQFNSWWTYSGNHKINNKIGLHTLYSFRRNNFVHNWQQSILRLGINYKVNQSLTFTPGYDWVVTFPYGEQPISKQTTEQRIFEQVVLKNKLGKIGILHRYRLEQRFVNQITKHRFRYRLGLKIPLTNPQKAKHDLFLSLFDEAFLNFGKKATEHYFDQNWFYIGLGIKLNKTTLQLGYMNQYLVKTDNTHIENNHTFQFGIARSLDFSKKENI